MNKIVSYKLKKVVLWSSLFLFLFSCSGNRDKKICQVGEHILYASELEVRKELFFPHLNDEEAKKKAIEQWIEQQGVKLEIESVSPKVKVAHELSIEDELMQLNLFELENQFITKHLDSIISDQEIQDYYESHRENYKAESYIVRALYIKVPDTVAGVLNIESVSPKVKVAHELSIEDELMQLNLFELENQFITKHLDSIISDQEIQDYYESHRENYKAESYIVRALYIKVPDTVAGVLNIDEHYLLKNDKDLEEIKKYANLYASGFYFEQERWIYFDDLVREIPISTDTKDDLIKRRGEAIFKDNGETHYINVLDFRTKSISSPMEVERAGIRRHILKRRVNNLRSTAKETILENVKEKYTVTYF